VGNKPFIGFLTRDPGLVGYIGIGLKQDLLSGNFDSNHTSVCRQSYRSI
jgi:hypothetical protein